MKLNPLALDNLPEGSHRDHIVPGLSCRVGKKRMTWVLRYVGAGKVQQTDTLGHYVRGTIKGDKSMSLTDARAKARSILDRVEAGVPVVAEPIVAPKEDGLTLGQLIDKYEKARRRKGGRGVKSLDEALRSIRYALKDYLPLPARRFGKRDLRKVRDAIAETAPQSSSRFLAYAGPLWKYADEEHDFGLDLLTVSKPAAPKKRDKVLTMAELKAIYQAAGKLEGTAANYGRMIRLLTLVPCRLGEAQNLKFGSIIDGQWKQLASENKGAREHRLQLPPLALSIIGEGRASDLVFPGQKGTAITGLSKLKRELDALSGVKDWVVHDLRRSITTHLQELTTKDGDPLVNRDTLAALLNHTIQGADAAYMHGTLAKTKARALVIWQSHCEKSFQLSRGNVVRLEKRSRDKGKQV